jgi:hypothetical protein
VVEHEGIEDVFFDGWRDQHARDRYSWRDVARRVTDLYEIHAPR